MGTVTLDRPWLAFDLGAQMQVLSWAVNRPGFVTANRIIWREVRNRDLPRDLDVEAWFHQELAGQGELEAVAFLTSRDVRFFSESHAQVGAVAAHAVATVGLSNGERVGRRVDYSGRDWGTINVALHLSVGLTQTALIEALSIAVQARTAAVMDAQFELPTGIATGTGTDCVAVAAPQGAGAYAGLHTETGEAIGRAVYQAVLNGALDWKSHRKE
ncbi:MAG: adenosylcobinamide amidohydrolase [Rhodobacteraceae bacterium]|nr:adenosylcobinamide amidohydrolase [Paracoccaceae bacterium]